jgi:hypothetical protein
LFETIKFFQMNAIKFPNQLSYIIGIFDPLVGQLPHSAKEEKEEESRNRPGMGHRVPGGLGSQIS